jgi:hypothetical protein
MQFRVYPQRCSRARGAGLLNRDRIGKLEIPAASSSGDCGIRLNSVQPASTYRVRKSATSSAVPYGQYRSNGSW